MDECILHDNKRCDFRYLDELAEWIEHRLKKMRQLAAEQSTSSESDVDEEEEMSEGTAMDMPTKCVLLLVIDH